MVCNITGTLFQPDGTIVSDRQFMIRLVDSTISAGPVGGIVPDVISGRTGVDGSIDIDLFPGNYTIAVEPALNANQRKQLIYIGPLSVPDEASARLEDLLVSAPIPVRAPGPVVMPTRGEAQVYSASHPGVMVVVPTGSGEPGAMYLGGVLVWDMQAGPPPVGLTFGLETEDGDVLITEDGDILLGEY